MRNWVAPGESGQALVEAAIILPTIVVFILCAIQLSQVQQARLLAEYAAFSAARVGVVHDMDLPAMRNAAVTAVLPSAGQTGSLAAFAATRAHFEAQDLLLRPFGLAQVQVAVLSPRAPAFASYGAHLNGRELDFDDLRPEVLPHTLLSLRIRYLYELRVPFAGGLLQALWLACKLGPLHALSRWSGFDFASPRMGGGRAGGAIAATQAGALAAGRSEDAELRRLALLARQGRYFLPLDAWQTMRMQSNPFLRWAAP